MVLNRQHRVRVAVKPLEEFADRVRQALRLPRREFTVCLVSDAAIARMNRAFRGKRGPTDVLSFPANGAEMKQGDREAARQGRRPTAEARRAQRNQNGAKGLSSTSYLGDIAISPETARRNAHRFGRSLPQELRILILHGALHLIGYDHEADHGEMNRLESRLRRRLGLS